MKKKIGIIGQFPPPLHGLSKALDTLYNSYLSEKYKLRKFDITNNRKFFSNVISIIRSNLDVYYLTISQSKYGNIRDLILLKIIQLKKKRIVIHLHGGGLRDLIENDVNKFQKNLNYKILNKVDNAIILGDSFKNIFKDIIDDNKVRVVKNCVDNDIIISQNVFDEKMKSLLIKNDINILYLSNFIQDKGYKEVLHLAKYAKDMKDNRFKFIFAGKFFNEVDKNEFFHYIDKNGLNKMVEYKGVVKGKEKKQLLEDSDYFILLTRYKNEGQPISIIEAGINGLKVISTNHAGIKDIFNNSEIYMLDKNNIKIKEIYEKIEFEYHNKNEMINILRKNREKMENEFSQESYLNSIDKIFMEE